MIPDCKITIMKLKNILSAVSVTALVALAACSTTKESQEQLKAQAKVTEAQARQTAQAKVPNGTIKEAELEKEHGKLIWSLDISTPDSKNITEVNVDAITGAIVSTEQETPEQQAKEKD